MKRIFSGFILAIVFSLGGIHTASAATSLRPTFLMADSASDEAACNASGGVYLSIRVNPTSPRCITSDGSNGGIIVVYLTQILQLLAGGVGIVVILMLIIGGIQYITAAGSTDAVRKAKGRIQNAITGLLLFILAYAILNFIIPGGIF